MDFVIEDLNGKALNAAWNQVLSVYRESFQEPPYNRDETHVIDFSSSLGRHTEQPGFRFRAARDLSRGELVGIVYGFTSARGQWWHDVVSSRAGPEITTQWLDGSFELVEFAVKPAAQGLGVGSSLHDAILDQLPHGRAVLSTIGVETVAQRMYVKRGWITLFEDFFFPNVPKAYRIMGLDLVRWREKNQQRSGGGAFAE